MINPICIVEVGTHTEPYWKDKKSNLIVCSRHRTQYEERDGYKMTFDWKEIKP